MCHVDLNFVKGIQQAYKYCIVVIFLIYQHYTITTQYNMNTIQYQHCTISTLKYEHYTI